MRIPVVAGLPFSGVMVWTTTGTLSGHTMRTESAVARDSAGRTYSEQRTPQIAGMKDDSRRIGFTVQDPIAKTILTCQTQTLECTVTALKERGVVRMMQVDAPGTEDLGAESIGGVVVTHTRESGRVQSNRPGDADGVMLKLTRDAWFSSDLQTPLRVVLADEQTGERRFDLQITDRKEPDAALFVMPKQYKLVDAPTPIKPLPLPPGVERIGNGVSAPRVLRAPEPEFSEEARRIKFSGNVLVSLIVNEQGLATDIKVQRGAGHGLDEKAVEAVQKYKFRPAMKDGVPVKVQMMVEVNFQRF